MLTLVRDINIIISGFMGTGKSSVGRALAERLGRPFIDTDEVIEERLDMSIPRIFEELGQSFFREQESLLAAELSASTGQVIATGGGTLIFEKNRQALGASGIIFNLNCAPEEILRRLHEQNDRPLLQTQDRLARIKALLEERQPAYATANFQIDTTSLSVDQIVDHIIKICVGQGYCADLFKVEFPSGSYNIWYGKGFLQRVGEILQHNGIKGTVAIVSNRNIFPLHGGALRKSLESAGFGVYTITIPDGEEYKTLRTIRHLYDKFLDLNLDRTSTIVALGGGVIGDIAGFAAATFMRGLPFVQVPTTLLAQVDSSIGGKVGFDHPRGKNLIGAFYPPKLVVTDPDVLSTLPRDQLLVGLAEVVKAGVIKSASLFENLERTGMDQLDQAIHESIRIKVDVVSEDPFEKGQRAILNFGHTIGHGLETASNYQFQHGHAVSLGMVGATKIAVKLSLCPVEVERRIVDLLQKLGLPTSCNSVSPAAIFRAMATDKKKQHGKLRYVLPVRIGEVIVTSEVPEEIVHGALAEVFPLTS